MDERYVKCVGPNGKVLLKSGFFALWKGVKKCSKAWKWHSKECISCCSKINLALWENSNTTKITCSYVEDNLEGVVIWLKSPCIPFPWKTVSWWKGSPQIGQVPPMLFATSESCFNPWRAGNYDLPRISAVLLTSPRRWGGLPDALCSPEPA